MLLKRLRAFAILAIAAGGLWLLWSECLQLARLSWWYDSTQVLHATSSTPDYDLTTLPWQLVHPRLFEIGQGGLTVATSSDPYGYQAYATINTNRANTAGITASSPRTAGASNDAAAAPPIHQRVRRTSAPRIR